MGNLQLRPRDYVRLYAVSNEQKPNLIAAEQPCSRRHGKLQSYKM